MIHMNLSIIDRFFVAYSRHDMDAISKELSENVKWTFPGSSSLSGTKTGINEVVNFFDKMGELMGKANVKVEKLVMGVNDNYVLECQYIKTDKKDSVNIDQKMCVLWTFENGKIIGGKHFTEDQIQADVFYNKYGDVK